LFFKHFTGNKIHDVTYRKPEPVSCDPSPLLRQAGGCLAKAIAYQSGKQASPADDAKYIGGFCELFKEGILHKVNLHVEELDITKGISLGELDKDSQ
jgi:hypothetical protein